MEFIRTVLTQWIEQTGWLSADATTETSTWLLLVLVVALLWTATWIAGKILTPLIVHLTSKTSTLIDDYFFNPTVLTAVWRAVAGLLFYAILPALTSDLAPARVSLVSGAAGIYMTITVVRLATAFLKSIATYSDSCRDGSEPHVLIIIQFVRVVVYVIGGIVVIGLLLGRNPLGFIAGLGAAAAALMFVFRDTILGLVAGIQLSAGRLLEPGDWVTVASAGIDGIVEEVTLTAVKVRAFDNTIQSIPPYTLVSGSFKNWKGMQGRKGRSVKRALHIDVNSIGLLTPQQRAKLSDDFNLPLPDTVKDEPTVNLTLFRHYATAYLRSLPGVEKDAPWSWTLVRQLEATPQGLPLEMWFYLKETAFVPYESQAADIFEHLIATLPAFGLRLFQAPTGHDLSHALNAGGN